MPIQLDVVISGDAFGGGQVPNPLPPYFGEDVTIVDDLFLGPMHGIRGDLYDACEPRGISWEPPSRAYPVHFVMGRRDAPGPTYHFDPDRQLKTCVQLSRLVQPTSLGYSRAGRVVLDEAGDLVRFAPVRIGGAAAGSFVADTSRNWLDAHQVAQLGALVTAFDSDSLPERVLQAFWHHEHAHQLYYVDVRWPLMTTGLEALVHTHQYMSTRQFVERLLAVQEEIGVSLADEALLRTLYDRRSSVVHGQRVGDLDPELRSQYMTLEDLLRAVLIRAMTDHSFAEIFESAESVRARWPLS